VEAFASDCFAIDNAIRLYVDDSDEVNEVLYKCSQELLEASFEYRDDEQFICDEVVGTSSEILESGNDLINEDHFYHKSICPDSSFNSFESDDSNSIITTENAQSVYHTNNQLFSKVLSPLSSCNSDSGYESSHPSSPSSYFDSSYDSTDDEVNMDIKMENNLNLDQSITELFPDLV